MQRCKYIISVISKILNDNNISINVIVGNCYDSFNNELKTIRIYINYEHTLVKKGGRDSQGAPEGIIKTQSQEVFKKYTGIFAISIDGVVGWDLYEKSGINADRMVEFLETHITNKFRNKLIILDNASSHRNPKVKEVITQHNHLLYAVPYQHFTNSIENYFSMLKSRLQKLDGLTHAELKENITRTIKNIPKEKYKNIIKGAYERPEKYVSKKNKTRKIKKNYL